MIALDLWGAVMVAGFTDYERLIVAEVVSRTYGPDKHRGVRFDLTSLSEWAGIDRRNLKRALSALVAAEVLSAYKDGSYGLQKDWERWTVKGKTLADRLGDRDGANRGRLVGWCLSLVDRYGLKGGARRSPKTTSNGTPKGADPGVQSNPSGGSIQPLQTTVIGVQSNPCDSRLRGFNPTPRLIEERASEELETREIQREERDTQNAGAGDSILSGSQPQREADDRADVREACRILGGHLETQHLADRLLRENLLPGLMPIEGWRFVVAANKALSGGVDPGKRGRWPYFLAMARDAEREATPGPRPPAGRASAAAPSLGERRDAERKRQVAAAIAAEEAKNGRVDG